MRRSIFVGAIITACMQVIGCSDPNQNFSADQAVVLYTSADDQLARLLADAFTEETGIAVDILGDTEATKTTGLVARILAERDDPKGDVWWSSEPMGTILLAESGALKHEGMLGTVAEDWPEELIGTNYSWIGFAQRARVIVYSTGRVANPPTTMRDLNQPEWRGRVGIARPQFGTTRGHMALLHARWGGDVFETWMIGLKDNGVRLYDGNMSVVRAIAMGEIDIGLTDTDDVYAGQDNGWEVRMVFETMDANDQLMKSEGATVIPNTVGILDGCPNLDGAMQLAEFLVSANAELIIARSPSRNYPVRAEIGSESGLADGPGQNWISYAEAHKSVDSTMDICERTLEGP
jgi:iron(III) transport system substrate-binding protein